MCALDSLRNRECVGMTVARRKVESEVGSSQHWFESVKSASGLAKSLTCERHINRLLSTRALNSACRDVPAEGAYACVCQVHLTGFLGQPPIVRTTPAQSKGHTQAARPRSLESM